QVCQLNGSDKICIKAADGSLMQLDMSASAYMKLFPPVERYATMQSMGDCWFLSTMDAIYKRPETTQDILKCFHEEANGNIVVTLDGKSVRFNPDTFEASCYENFGRSNYGVDNMTGALGFKMLEQMAGYTYIETKINWLTNSLSRLDPYSPEYQKQAEKLWQLTNSDLGIWEKARIAREGGWPEDVYKMFGIQETSTHFIQYSRDFLSNINNWDKYVFSVITDGTSDELFLNADLKIAQNHAYGVQPYLSPTGDIMFKVTNPWDCASEINLTMDEFMYYFKYLTIAKVA
ncbi:hypothetical protein IJ531_07010, partial [bacterium]|nr:hypothetical protein [bacterium]